MAAFLGGQRLLPLTFSSFLLAFYAAARFKPLGILRRGAPPTEQGLTPRSGV